MSKHGDAPTTRKNKPSPWDIVHPGRSRALDDRLVDAVSPDQIKGRTGEILKKVPPRADHASLLDEILRTCRQDEHVDASDEMVSPIEFEASGPAADEVGYEEE